jgi:hypothetical protein
MEIVYSPNRLINFLIVLEMIGCRGEGRSNGARLCQELEQLAAP